MLPPVFYVQQLEQILLRKLLSPPTPAARPLRPRAARLYPYSVFSFAFFARFFVPSHVPLVSCVCAAPPLSFPAPRACPSRRICAYIRIQFFRSLFSCRAASIDLARLRCAPLSFPAPRARPSRHICAYIYIQFFVRFSRVEPRPLISRICVVRPTHLYQYSVFVSHFHFRPRPFGSAFVIFCFLVFPSTRISAGFMIFSYGESTSNHL